MLEHNVGMAVISGRHVGMLGSCFQDGFCNKGGWKANYRNACKADGGFSLLSCSEGWRVEHLCVLGSVKKGKQMGLVLVPRNGNVKLWLVE